VSLTAVRVRFITASGAFRANEIAWFSPTVAQALADAGVATLVDAVPASTPHVLKASTAHMVNVARASEQIASEADRVVVSMLDAAPVT